MKELEKFCKLAIKLGAKDAKIINAKDVFISEWVRIKCQFGCNCYGSSLMCPPYSPDAKTMKKILKNYNFAILIHCDNFSNIKKIIPELERRIFLSNYYATFGFVAGPCYLCNKCNLKYCKYPDEARPSMEASSIDVFKTVRKAGFKINVLKSINEKENYFGLVLIE